MSPSKEEDYNSDDEVTYTVVRKYRNGSPDKIIETMVTIEEAQEHCKDSETSSRTCKGKKALEHTEKYGEWFDCYYEE
jgi:hypothetical protein